MIDLCQICEEVRLLTLHEHLSVLRGTYSTRTIMYYLVDRYLVSWLFPETVTIVWSPGFYVV